MDTLIVSIERNYDDTAYSIEIYASDEDRRMRIPIDSSIARTDDMVEAFEQARSVVRHCLARLERNNRSNHVPA